VVFEGAVAPNSEIIGQSISELNFRQRFRVIVLAIHRGGENVREKLETLPLQMGDILLMMGTEQAVNALRSGNDIILFDRPPLPSLSRHRRIPLVLATIAAVVTAETFGVVPIHLGAIAGACSCASPAASSPRRHTNRSSGICSSSSSACWPSALPCSRAGAAAWLAKQCRGGVDHRGLRAAQTARDAGCLYLIDHGAHGILSNNAVAALMAPIALGIAAEAGLEARPFVIAVTVAASAAFATPIGYQTNTYIYGIGGYRFRDFVRVGRAAEPALLRRRDGRDPAGVAVLRRRAGTAAPVRRSRAGRRRPGRCRPAGRRRGRHDPRGG
jgi:di/tricarboxylate transporter